MVRFILSSHFSSVLFIMLSRFSQHPVSLLSLFHTSTAPSDNALSIHSLNLTHHFIPSQLFYILPSRGLLSVNGFNRMRISMMYCRKKRAILQARSKPMKGTAQCNGQLFCEQSFFFQSIAFFFFFA